MARVGYGKRKQGDTRVDSREQRARRASRKARQFAYLPYIRLGQVTSPGLSWQDTHSSLLPLQQTHHRTDFPYLRRRNGRSVPAGRSNLTQGIVSCECYPLLRQVRTCSLPRALSPASAATLEASTLHVPQALDTIVRRVRILSMEAQ